MSHLSIWLRRVPFRPYISRAADTVRRQVGRVDNAEVRKARRLARASRAGQIDVLYLGDSTTSFVAGYDTDARPLHAMIADRIGRDVNLTTIHGGSYAPPLYDAFLRFVDAAHKPKVVLVPLWTRGCTTPWFEHPAFGHRKAIDFLQDLDPATPVRRIRKGFPRPTTADFDTFYQLPYPTWAGDWNIGEYVRRLKGSNDHDTEWVRLLYAYHYGGLVESASQLDAVRALGVHLRALDIPVVVYQTPLPVQKGVDLLGSGFLELARGNYARLEQALHEGFGPIDVLQTGCTFGTEEFIDWRDGSEHLNQVGRLRLAEEIGAAVRAALGAHVGGGARA